MADDRELLEAELQALMEVSADFSKGLSTVASRMRAIKSHLNSNVRVKTASSPTSRAKVRMRDSATSPIMFRTTRCTSISPDRFDNNLSNLNILDTTTIKTENDEDLYDEHGGSNHAAVERAEMERIQQQRKEQERAICSVGDICSVTRGALNVLSPGGAGGVTTTRILSTTGGINSKASLIKVANAAAQAAAATNTKNGGKPSGLIYILKPMGSGGMNTAKALHNPLKFGTVKKMRRILPHHNSNPNIVNVSSRVGGMNIFMNRTRQKILPKLSENLRSEDSSNTRVSNTCL